MCFKINIDHLHTAKRGEAGGMKLYNLHFYNKALFGQTGRTYIRVQDMM